MPENAPKMVIDVQIPEIGLRPACAVLRMADYADMTVAPPTSPMHRTDAIAMALFGIFQILAATVIAAHGFERIGGYIPCALCLEQRQPYYFGLPLLFIAGLAVKRRWAMVGAAAALAGGVVILYGAGLAAYHSGIEWGFWPGPDTCALPAPTSPSGGILDQLNRIPPSCSEAVWRFLGLSFAGWNFVMSSIFGLGAVFLGWMSLPSEGGFRSRPN